MANPKGNPGTLAPPFAPGNNANPGGKPVGARNRLQGKFLGALANDFDRFGVMAIARMRKSDPGGYVKAIASLMPKEIEVSKAPLEEMSDDELARAVAALQSFLAAQSAPEGKPAKAGRKQAEDVPPLH